MDITAVFGTAIGGSNPSGSTRHKKANCFAVLSVVLCAAMFRKLAEPRAGVASDFGDGQSRLVTTSKIGRCDSGWGRGNLIATAIELSVTESLRHHEASHKGIAELN